MRIVYDLQSKLALHHRKRGGFFKTCLRGIFKDPPVLNAPPVNELIISQIIVNIKHFFPVPKSKTKIKISHIALDKYQGGDWLQKLK
jgi:hypothetical protein